MEFALPVGFVAILLLIKNSVDSSGADTVPPLYPANSRAFRPLSFQDYLTAVRAEKVCEEQGVEDGERELGISGMANQGSNWMVPMVKCDSRKCDEAGQDASTFCEYSIIAVAGSNANGLERAQDFRGWMVDRYPELLTDMPFDFDPIRVFDTSQDIDAYVRRNDYGESGVPKVMIGVVWESNNENNYDYRIRLNQTNFNNPPDEARPGAKTAAYTDTVLDSFANDDFSACTGDEDGLPDQGPLEDSCTGKYLYNGVLTIQRVVGDYILDRTGAADAGYAVSENGVQFVQFPTKSYEEEGFYGDLGDYGPILVALGLLYPVATMIGFITREKELRQKELMKMMSVTEAEM